MIIKVFFLMHMTEQPSAGLAVLIAPHQKGSLTALLCDEEPVPRTTISGSNRPGGLKGQPKKTGWTVSDLGQHRQQHYKRDMLRTRWAQAKDRIANPTLSVWTRCC